MGEQIMSGTITFTTDDFLIQLSDNGQFVDVSGPAVRLPTFDESHFQHRRASVLGHMGDRVIDGVHRVKSLVAAKIVSHADIGTQAYFMYQANPAASALDNWLRAERDLLGV
jgi:hypothetical protein